MAEKRYRVVSRGTVLDGFEPEEVKRFLVARLGLSEETAAGILSSRRVVLKKGLNEATARKWGKALRRAGLDVVLAAEKDSLETRSDAGHRDGPDAQGPQRALQESEPARTDGPPDQSRPGPSRQETTGITTEIPFEFHGTGWEYFKIWLVNTVLTILTFGIYSAWAKVRRKRYLYGSTRLQGSGFEYLADPVKILKGRALVVAVFIAYSVLDQISPLVSGILGLGFIVILPWLVVRSLTFNARYSALRNIRFGFHGSLMDAAKAYVLWPILIPFTLGIIFPYVYYCQKKFVVENHRYGTAPFSFTATAGDYYGVFLVGLVPLFIGGVFIVVLAFLFSPLSFLAGAVLYFYLFAYFSVKTTNLLFNSSRLESHRFVADLRTRDYTALVITNSLGIALTLGLFYAWAQIRTLRYKVRHLTLVAAEDLDGFVAAEQEQVSALGEEMSDFFDIDVGL